MQKSGVKITPNTLFSDLSVELATLGGIALHDILKDGEESLNNFKANKIDQSTLGSTTAASFIKPDFGELRFAELTNTQV